MPERRKRTRRKALVPRFLPRVNAGVISSSLSFSLFGRGRSARTRLFDTWFSPWPRARAINHTGNSRAPGIYIRFVEIVMNLRPTMLCPGSRPEGPVVGFHECTSYFLVVSVVEGCFGWFRVNKKIYIHTHMCNTDADCYMIYLYFKNSRAVKNIKIKNRTLVYIHLLK